MPQECRAQQLYLHSLEVGHDEVGDAKLFRRLLDQLAVILRVIAQVPMGDQQCHEAVITLKHLSRQADLRLEILLRAELGQDKNSMDLFAFQEACEVGEVGLVNRLG